MNRWLACLMLALAIGCDERGGGSTVVPEGGSGDSELRPEGEHEGETMAELEVRLDKLVARQTNMVAASTGAPNQCEALCELSRAICEIKTKMCSIAEDRVTDPEYQNLCRKAKQRCSDASESCIQCVERNGGSGEATCEGEPSESPPGR